MPIILPDPDGMRRVPGGYLPIWQCIHCESFKTFDGYGTRLMNGDMVREHAALPDWRKQSWCLDCRVMSLGSSRNHPSQPSLPDLFGTAVIEDALLEMDDLPDYLSDDGFGSLRT